MSICKWFLLVGTAVSSVMGADLRTQTASGEYNGAFIGEHRNVFVPPSDQVFPHLAVGGGWETILVIVNMTNRRMDFAQSFYSPDGRPLSVTFRSIPDGAITTTAATRGTLNPGGSFNILLVDDGSAVKTGWASLD